MRLFQTIAIATLTVLTLSGTAEARRGGGGSAEMLEYVAPTTIPVAPGSDTMMSLCHLVKKNHAVFIPIFYESEGYVLSDANCGGESYFSLAAEQFTAAKAEGLIGADVPDVAQLSALQKIVPYLWGALALFGIGLVIRQKIRKSGRHRAMGGVSPAVAKLIDAMCHAAKADGNVDDSEILAIGSIAKKLTGTTYPPTKIRKMIDLSESKLSLQQFQAFGKGLSVDQKELVMQAVLMVVGADGNFATNEQKFVSGLAQGLQITQPQFNRIVGEARAAAA